MIPIVREFFRGLKERDELDAILPELLTAMGFEVLSKPMVGTRQYGADLAAIGVDTDGERKLFLFSIKRGDLNRREWDGDADQALRQSLNEIRDVYRKRVAPQHRGLRVVICITIGGVVLENTLPMVNGYMDTETKDNIEFQLWTGDTLATKVVDGAMREEVFPAEMRTLLRRAAALVEEPETSVAQFSYLVDDVAADEKQPAVARVRTLYLALWILTVWGREAGNLEAPYRASELVVLHAWKLLWKDIAADKTRKLVASNTFYEVVALHLRIWDELYREKVLPHASSLHAISFAVGSHESIDVNLALFETAGRIAMGGLWRAWLAQTVGEPLCQIDLWPGKALSTAQCLADLIGNNPALYTPNNEAQGVDVGLGLMLLSAFPQTRADAVGWATQMSRATRISYNRRQGYPIRMADYETLLRLSLKNDDQLKDATSATIIQPILAAFAWGLSAPDLATEIDEFQSSELNHSNFQIWVVNSRTDEKLWAGGRAAGSSRGSLKIGPEGSELIDVLRREIQQNTAHAALSAIQLDHWPILLLACRVHRLPPPPQLWMPLLEKLVVEAPPQGRPAPNARKSVGGIAKVQAAILKSTSYIALMLKYVREQA